MRTLKQHLGRVDASLWGDEIALRRAVEDDLPTVDAGRAVDGRLNLVGLEFRL
jgi:hypothetical protein